MAKLDKGTLALTFKFDCDRFLRLRLADKHDLDSLGINQEKYKRPGIELMAAAGRRWEAEKYQDLIDTTPNGEVVYTKDNKVDPLLGLKPFKKVPNLFDILRNQEPPTAIIEAEFRVPTDITPALQEAYDKYGLQEVSARPDILWIRKAPTGKPLLLNQSPEYEIHIIDVKMAAEPSLRHFTEVTYYALALAAAIKKEGLDRRYSVCAEGMIWPGSHDANAFRNFVAAYTAKGSSDAVGDALTDTLVAVPYEVYEIHVRHFFEERLLQVLNTKILDTSWHVSSKCQLCDYVRYCKELAEQCDHLSQLAWLNQGQAEILYSNNIYSVAELTDAINSNDSRWIASIESNHQLRAEQPAIYARARALHEGELFSIQNRRTALMPSWTDQSIFLTIHFDPGSGITFALGASRLYFPKPRTKGDPPITEEKVFIVDRVNAMNPETERQRLIEFVNTVTGWMEEVSSLNEALPSYQRLTSHVFFWDNLEVRQLKRMIERHMNHPDVIELVNTLMRFFPPDSIMPDPDAFKSQPGTTVKEVVRVLFGLPISHDYSLFDVANCFYPNILKDGSSYTFRLPFGFSTPMSDQIPFERAYELWQDKIFVRHYNSSYPNNPELWPHYTRDELYDAIKHATKIHLHALMHITRKLREHHRDSLLLEKSGFTIRPTSQPRLPQEAKSLIAFEKLNVTCQEIENKNVRALPTDEREARFFSIRGLRRKAASEEAIINDEIRLAEPDYIGRDLYVFSFSENSRDSRIKEKDFTITLSNEDSTVNFYRPW